MPDWEVQPLRQTHNRSSFDCGNTALNDWLQKRAGQWQRKEISRCYVAVHKSATQVCGYYSLSSHYVGYESLPTDQAKGLPKIDVPVVLLGRLAVDQSIRGQGLGAILLIDALRRTETLAGQLGIRAVEVDAIDEAARHFYLKFGFTPLKDDPNHLFLPLHVIRKLKIDPH
jgi:GNAT superfamily N-acetyltransferase